MESACTKIIIRATRDTKGERGQGEIYYSNNIIPACARNGQCEFKRVTIKIILMLKYYRTISIRKRYVHTLTCLWKWINSQPQ